MKKRKVVIGIDEAGRGPLAGPVCVGVCALSLVLCEKLQMGVWGPDECALKDSKKLSQQAREAWYAYMKEKRKEGEIDYAVSFVGASVIDRIGIVKAISLAMSRALERLGVSPDDAHILLDGGLRPPEKFSSYETLIRGDETEPIISCASVVAKVTRDNHMHTLHKKYPAYGFDRHKGYGTQEHYKMIRKYGISPEHRKSFLKGR